MSDLPGTPIMKVYVRDDGKVGIMLRPFPGEDQDPALWGIVLVDLLEHVANMYGQMGHDPKEARARVLEFVNREIRNRTDAVRGEFLETN